ncbi:MAG: hypothetical protein ACFFFG_12240 [Candidatus Thorarchaeota archaeon]
MSKKFIPTLKPSFSKIISRHRSVSPILAAVIIFALILVGVMVTYIQIIPFIDRAQTEESITAVRNSFLELDSTIKSLISESGAPGGFSTILMQVPSGQIDYTPESYHVGLRLVDRNDQLVYNIFNDIDPQDGILDIGILDWVYNSPQAVLPRGSFQYLTGPNPYEIRDQVFITGPFSTTAWPDITNLTLSHQNDRRHHISLNYRIAIHLSIETSPTPEIRFQIFLVLLSGDFGTLRTDFKQVSVHVQQNSTPPVVVPGTSGLAQLDLVWERISSSGGPAIDSTIWSTRSLQGISNLAGFDVIVQPVIYHVNLSTP